MTRTPAITTRAVRERRAAAGPGRRHTLTRLVWVVVAFACAGLLVFAGWAAWSGHRRAVEQASVTSQNIARALMQHTERMIDSVDMLLKMTARELGPDAADPVRRSSVTATLAYVTQNLRHVLAVRVLDGQTGELLFDFVRSREIGEAGDRATVAAHARETIEGLVVGLPTFDPVSRSWLTPVSRRIGGRVGIAGNIVVAHIAVEAMVDVLREIELGEDGVLSIIRTDGRIIARHPFNAAHMGQDVSASPLFRRLLPKAPFGTYDHVAVSDGVRRIFAYRRLEAAPLVVTIGIARSVVLSAWMANARRDFSIALGAMLLLVVAGVFLSREARRRDAAECALVASEERMRLSLQAARMVAWEQDPSTDFVMRSDNARELLGLGSGHLQDYLERVHPEDRVGLLTSAEGATGEAAVEYRYRQPDGTEIWLASRGTVLQGDGAAPRLVGVTFDITDRKLAEEAAWRAAHHDVLTGLANRALFQQRLEEALGAAARNGHGLALLLVDLDDFKSINDTLGHDAGDALLKATAERLKAAAGEAAVARLGGDEFAVILIGCDAARSGAEADRILKALHEPFAYEGLTLASRASIGIAVYPDHHTSPSELMKDADMALYAAKEGGRHRAVIYAAHMRQSIEHRMTVARGMRAALAEGEILPYYQPNICLATGRIIGFEALARWRHPRRGLLTPSAFASAFEDPELAVAIGQRMMAEIASDIRRWLGQGLDCGRIALNLSTAEFREPHLADALLETLAAAQVPTRFFEVEVTETVLLGHAMEQVSAMLHRLRDGGVRIALDDFGTGYASLTHLKQFPVDDIKIDQSFVRDLERDEDDAAIVAAVIGLGRSLGKQVIAEGVETEGQLRYLRERGCNSAQGYLFAKPMIGSRVEGFLRGHTPERWLMTERLIPAA